MYLLPSALHVAITERVSVERRMLSLVQKSDQLNDANNRLQRAEDEPGKSTSGGSTASGSVTRVNLRTGYMLYIYHKVQHRARAFFI